MNSKILGLWGVLTVCILSSCTREGPRGFLSLIPANTPYVIAATERLPQDVISLFIGRIGEVSRTAQDMWVQIAANVLLADSELAQGIVLALVDEFEGKLNLDRIGDLGLRLDPYFAVYSFEMLPIFRIELADTEKFRALVGRVEGAVARNLPISSFQGNDYWLINLGEFSWFIAVHNNSLVSTLLPNENNEVYLSHLFAEKYEGDSLAGSSVFMDFIEENDFQGYSPGYVDFRRLSEIITRDESDNIPLFQALNLKMSKLSDVCRDELNVFTKDFPRLFMGYKEFTNNTIIQQLGLELSPILAGKLQALTSEIPGLGMNSGVMSMGYGLNIENAQALAVSIMDNISQQAYQCEWFEGLNDVAALKDKINSPMQAMVNNVRGVHVSVESFELAEGSSLAMPNAVNVQALISLNNPQELWGMVALLQPEIGKLSLLADAPPIELPAETLMGFSSLGSVYVAMSEHAIAVSVGYPQGEKLQSFMNAKSPDNPPVLAFSYDMQTLAPVYQNILRATLDSMGDEQKKVIQDQIALIDIYGSFIGKVAVTLNFTEKGIIYEQHSKFH